MIEKYRFYSVGGMQDVVAINFKEKTVETADGDIRDISSGHLLQYTGLKDKNGKDIYGGDIVKVGKIYLVSWHNRFCSFTIKSKGDLHNHFFGEAFEAEDCEVIGNKFENPKLLESNIK